MPRALVLGGTGAIGLAVARRLLAHGWTVDLTGRDPSRLPTDVADAGGRLLVSERRDRGQLETAVGSGADLLVDCVCFTADDAITLLAMAQHAASTVMLSSKAVYVDAAGNHSNSDVAPRFEGPIHESQPTVAPGNGDYDSREGYGRNKVAAEHVLLDSGLPVTVLRPSKVHGPGARRPREWVFVKRVIDRRPALLLARPSSIDHTTGAANIAALVEVVASHPGARILNCADPDAPTALEIARVVAAQLGHRWDEVIIDDECEPTLGRHPWDAPHPLVLDTAASTSLGYAPVGDYATTVRAELEWLVACAAGGPDATLLPEQDDPFFAPLLDYGAEDRFLRERDRRGGPPD
jgi:nucleoside-diphosphate-sugar epimerase